ncbi:MAG TPA: pitrilysin family protein [Pseudonocardiaceae bacterium]
MPRITAPELDLRRLTLDNGLRVVLAPDTSAPVVAVAAHYDVGFRSEPVGRTGFAHLFEHLMFQGSESLPKLAHFRHVQGSGGTFNGSTHFDYTDYFEVLPSAALERALFLEADRMRAPTISEENLRNQVDVVKEEIRLNVLNRPYGGFPWILLPPVLYDTFANAHNGYGDFVDLEEATVEDCAAFFDSYYAPANAVLTVAGDFEVDAAIALVHKHFDDVPARPAPKRPSFAEPAPTSEKRADHQDRLAPLPAFAVGYRVPDPGTDLAGYTARVALASVLTDGDAARLRQRMIYRDELVTDVSAGVGLFGMPYDARDPDTMTITAVHLPDVGTDSVLAVVDEEVARVARDGVSGDELRRTAARWSATMFRDHDRLATRTRAIGACELLYGRGELAAELPTMIAAVTTEQVAEAAAELRPDSRAVLTITPSGEDGQAPGDAA